MLCYFVKSNFMPSGFFNLGKPYHALVTMSASYILLLLSVCVCVSYKGVPESKNYLTSQVPSITDYTKIPTVFLYWMW